MFHAGTHTSFQGALTTADIALVPISYVETTYPPIVGCNGLAKRVFDIAGALALLLTVGWLMFPIAILICWDSPGPILFRQRRVGYGNIPFETLKFRTMRHGRTKAGGFLQTVRNDPRVTRVGHVLRRLSLDELPQLFNVLRGEMSLVGPRPHAPGTCAGGKPFEMVTPRYAARHRVRPGMTGLAQVRGLRGATETEDKLLRRVDADLEYIENWSPLLDLTILARTVKSVVGTQNAY